MKNTEQALALLEFDSAAFGMLAVDRMVKRSPIALLRCGTVHPGRYLVLVGGSVASTEEAFEEGLQVGEVRDQVLLPDPHPELAAALMSRPATDAAAVAMGVIETNTSPALLRSLDAALKTAPVHLVELRLGDDLGGRGLGILAGELTDLQAALEVAGSRVGANGQMVARTLMPRVDESLRDIVGDGTHYGSSRARTPAGAEEVGK